MMLTVTQKNLLLEIGRDSVRFDEPMAAHSTMKIGGPADAFVVPRDIETLKAVMRFAVENEVPYITIGGGSDTLIRDGGIRGIVIHLREGFNRFEVSREEGEDVLILADAGVSSGAVTRFAAEQGLSGLEGLAGIPGTVGGNIITNAGTSLGWISNAIDEITVVDRQIRELTMKKKALEFSYRHLRMPRSTSVVRALLRLKRGDKAEIETKMNGLLEKRKTTQPYGQPTLGCTFRNPEKGGKHGSSAGALIDEAGLKGIRVGKARVSEIHANFIINEGGATAKDVEILIGLVRERVKEKFSVLLETEIHVIGEK